MLHTSGLLPNLAKLSKWLPIMGQCWSISFSDSWFTDGASDWGKSSKVVLSLFTYIIYDIHLIYKVCDKNLNEDVYKAEELI